VEELRLKERFVYTTVRLLLLVNRCPTFLMIGGVLLARGSEGDQRRVGLTALRAGAGLAVAAFFAVGTTAI
jgi:hypothetical protein